MPADAGWEEQGRQGSDGLGPFSWLVPLATILLPMAAAKRGSKWWLAVTAAAIITFVVFLRMVLD
jgi:hypothetical protein